MIILPIINFLLFIFVYQINNSISLNLLYSIHIITNSTLSPNSIQSIYYYYLTSMLSYYYAIIKNSLNYLLIRSIIALIDSIMIYISALHTIMIALMYESHFSAFSLSSMLHLSNSFSHSLHLLNSSIIILFSTIEYLLYALTLHIFSYSTNISL